MPSKPYCAALLLSAPLLLIVIVFGYSVEGWQVFKMYASQGFRPFARWNFNKMRMH